MKWFWGFCGIVGLLIFGLWIRDVWKDRSHALVVNSTTPVFAGRGNNTCEGTRLVMVQHGESLRVLRIRYWKNCATIDVALQDGRKGFLVLDTGVSVYPPLP